MKQKDKISMPIMITYAVWILPFSACDAHVSCLATRIAAKNPTNGKFLTQQCSLSCTNSFKARSEAAKRARRRIVGTQLLWPTTVKMKPILFSSLSSVVFNAAA